MSAPEWYRYQPFSPHQVYSEAVIRDIQRTLSVPESGRMDEATISHVKGLQYALGIPGTGRIDEATATGIQQLRDRYAVQEREAEEVPPQPEA